MCATASFTASNWQEAKGVRWFLGIAAAVLIATGAEAADSAPDFRASRVEILLGETKGAASICDVTPTSAEIAATAAEILTAQIADFPLTKEIALLPPGAKNDPAALKIAFDVEVLIIVDNIDDGPRVDVITIADKFWGGASEVFPEETDPAFWEVDLHCGEEITQAVHNIVTQHARRLAAQLKKAQGGAGNSKP